MSIFDKEIARHDSFGMISVSRVSGHADLVGCNVSHGHFVKLCISEMQIGESGGHAHYLPTRKPHVEIYLSFSQWAALVSSFNTTGVPCTVRGMRNGDWVSVEPLRTPSEAQRMRSSLSARAKELFGTVSAMVTKATVLAKSPRVTKADVHEVANLAAQVSRELHANFPFYMESMQAASDKMVAEAKTEIESYVTQEYIAKGLKAAGTGSGDTRAVKVPWTRSAEIAGRDDHGG